MCIGGLTLNIQIRRASAGDAPCISKLVYSLSHFYLCGTSGVVPYWFSEAVSEKAIVEHLIGAEYHSYVADHNGVVGYISVCNHHLCHLFVAETMQNRGVAKALWSHVLRLHKIDLCTVRSSVFAVPFYKKLGFIVNGEVDQRDGITYQPMVYQKVS